MRRDFWRNVKLLLTRLSPLDVNEQQQLEIDYLREENQTLRDRLKATGKRMILTDAQRKNLGSSTDLVADFTGYLSKNCSENGH